MSKTVYLTIQATVDDKASVSSVAAKLFNFLAEDPCDHMPELETVDGYDYSEPGLE